MEKKSLLQEFYSELLFVENHGKLTAETYLICVQEFLDYLEKNETPLEKLPEEKKLRLQKICPRLGFLVRF